MPQKNISTILPFLPLIFIFFVKKSFFLKKSANFTVIKVWKVN
jgi:hypothetical protein